MSKIARYSGNLRAFGSNAQGLERTLFGETTQADDLTSQITAAFLRGWGIVGPSENPSLEDFNAAMYTMSQFIAYQHQMGVPEWDAAQEYYIGSLCVRGGETYLSIVNSNTGSAPPSAKWTQVITVKNGLSSLGIADASGYVGRLMKVQAFSASGAYNPTAGSKKIKVTAIGGGGGGGGSAATDSTTRSCGGGGGAGNAVVSVFNVADITFPVNINIGSAGVGGAAGGSPGGNGGAGGATSFGSLFTVLGGFGGGGGTLTNDTVPLVAPNGGTPAQPTIGNLLNIKGSAGLPGVIGGNAIVSGAGGASLLGGGGNPIATGSSTGGDVGVYGGGGSGAISVKSSSTGRAGGTGGAGIVIIEEYA